MKTIREHAACPKENVHAECRLPVETKLPRQSKSTVRLVLSPNQVERIVRNRSGIVIDLNLDAEKVFDPYWFCWMTKADGSWERWEGGQPLYDFLP